jgi:Tol biopolymer transport system component
VGRTSRIALALAALVAAGCERAASAPPPEASAPSVAPGAAAPAAAGPAAGGPTIAYERTIAGNQDLYVTGPDGQERRLTDAAGTDMLPRWSRDGRTIYFASERTGNWQLYTMPAGGGPAHRLRTNAFREWQVEPSPDGRRIAFLSNQGGPEQLWVMDLATGAERMIVAHGRKTIFGNPSWSSDGQRLTYSSNAEVGHQIYVANADGTGQERLTGFRRGGCEPRFHPDGRHVLHVSRGHVLGDKSRIVQRDLASGEETVLVAWPALNYTPTYSPDASEIAFTSNIDGDWAIYRQRISDRKSWRVTFGPGPARSPEYKP